MTTQTPQGRAKTGAAAQPHYVQHPNPETGEMATYVVYQTANGPVGHIVEPSALFAVPNAKARKDRKGMKKALIAVGVIAAVLGLSMYAVPRFTSHDKSDAAKSGSVFDSISPKDGSPESGTEGVEPSNAPSTSPNASTVPGIVGVDSPVNEVVARTANDLNAWWTADKGHLGLQWWNNPKNITAVEGATTPSELKCGNPTIMASSLCKIGGPIVFNAEALTKIQKTTGDGGVMFAMSVGYAAYALEVRSEALDGKVYDFAKLNVNTMQAVSCVAAVTASTIGWIPQEDAAKVLTGWLDAVQFEPAVEDASLDAMKLGLRDGIAPCLDKYIPEP